MTGPTRALLADAACRGADYLESVDSRPVYPRDADIARLREALAHEFADEPLEDAKVLAFLDEYGSPATVGPAGGATSGS